MDKLLMELEKSGCDVQGALNRFVNNENMYVKFLRNFPLEKTYSKFLESLAAKDYASAYNEIHTFKGVTGTLGLTELFEISKKISSFLKNGNYEEIDIYVALLKVKYSATVENINNF